MKAGTWLPFAWAKRRRENREAGKAEKPLTGKEVKKQIRSGKLTKEQALELRRRYMDSLEYKAARCQKTRRNDHVRSDFGGHHRQPL